jgi:RNA polymerase sigma factor (sigma-70 family)
MTIGRAGAVLRQLGREERPTGETDGELLERFVRHRDEGAIELLVQHHAPMVWGVCRRILQNHHDAEDALQATFIVLVRRAASIVPRETVANWLHGVARQTALKARQMIAKRNGRERQVVETPEPMASEVDLWNELEPWLDQELAALPEKYRVLIVLCDLEGRTRREVAEQLTLPEGTVAGRLARARTMLAARLTRRGLPVSAILLPGVLATGASAAVPSAAVFAAVQMTISCARGMATGSATLLADGVIKAMFVTKLKLATTVFVALVAISTVAWLPLPSSSAGTEPEVSSKPRARDPGSLLGGLDVPEPADISGRWQGEDWGQVELKRIKPGIYEGTYTDTFGPGPGTITLKWSAEDRRFTGAWAEGKDRYGVLSVRPDGREIRGAFTTDPNCKIRPGKPALADLRWVRGDEKAKPAPVGPRENPPVKNRWEKRLEDKDLKAKQRAAYEQLAKLHTVKLDQDDHRGTIHIPSWVENSKLPTDVLYKMGVDVLPILAEALDDETPTATVTSNRNRDRKVWKVNEFVALLVVRIADRTFVIGEPDKEFEIRSIGLDAKKAPEFRKVVVDWHTKFASKTPTERKIADVRDPYFRNRFDAVIWLGNSKSKEGRAPIAVRVDDFYADEKRGVDSTTRAEMSHCALALGQIGDKESLPQVRRICADMSWRLETYGIGGSQMLYDLFQAYHGLALLGGKDEAVKELERLVAAHGAKFEASSKKEYAERLKDAKDW